MTETATQTSLSATERVFTYRVLSNLLGRELSQAQFGRLQAGEFAPFFAYLGQCGFGPTVAALQKAFEQTAALPQPHLELAADFAQCFLLEDKLSALPYASAYLSGAELDENLAQTDRLLERFQLQLNRQINEPGDHLCVYLEILITLCEHGHPIDEQRRFIRRQLLTWLPQLAQRAALIPLKSDYYPLLLRLLQEILTAH